jgi:glyoxylase-like metal-dependent hydrolase (beta-lactamase superfamily II)
MAHSELKEQNLEVPKLVLEGASYDLWSNQSGQFRNNTYVIVDRETGSHALVDPLDNCLECWSSFFGDQLRPFDTILITHAHIDHVCGVAQLIDAYPDVKIFAHHDGVPLMTAEDVPKLTGGIETLNQYAEQFDSPLYQPVRPTDYLHEGETIHIGNTPFKILYTPGHCPGHVAFLNDKTLISGDVVYKGSVGFTNIPGSDPAVLADTIVETMLPLGDGITIFPGHGPITTMEEERKTNPFIVEALKERA